MFDYDLGSQLGPFMWDGACVEAARSELAHAGDSEILAVLCRRRLCGLLDAVLDTRTEGASDAQHLNDRASVHALIKRWELCNSLGIMWMYLVTVHGHRQTST